jgi:hypothetical protein
MSRAGQIETPVLMLFAVGAGILVLLTVGYFVLGAQSANAEAEQLLSLAAMRATVRSLEASPGLTVNTTIGAGELRVQCEPGNGYSVATGSAADEARITFVGHFLAVPQRLNGDLVTMSSTPVGSPYRVGTLVYAYNPQLVLYAGADIPALPMPVEDGPYGNITVRHAGQDPQTLSVTALDTNPTIGTIGLPSRASQIPQEVVYIGPELLAAAAITTSAEEYGCVLDQYLLQLAFETELQHRRLEELRNEYAAQGHSCAAIYDEEPFDAIEQIVYLSYPTVPINPNEIRRHTTTALNLTEAQALSAAFDRIRVQNERLVRGDRCATIS